MSLSSLSLRDTLLLGYARVFPAGLSPVAPGTCGSLVAIILAPFLFMPLPLWGRVLFLFVIFFTGTYASTRAEQILKREDPSEVVIDEVLGQWVTCLPFASFAFWEYGAAFVLFRLFDITKPPPIRAFERLPSGLGIMADDAVAGVFAMIIMALIRYFVYG